MEERLPNNKRCRVEHPTDVDKHSATDENSDDRLYRLILDIQEQRDTYLDAPLIMEGFKKLVEEHSEGMINRCTVCNIDIGRHNPRQLCGKIRCLSE